jgi:UDP-3-O-[3-hydroxymyristoyl] glucosamine N-acyltransferase
MSEAAKGIPRPGAWPTGLRDLLAQPGEPFGAIEVRNAAALDEARQTGFAWTLQPGVVCLAMNRDYFAQAAGNPSARVIIAPAAAISGETPQDKALLIGDSAEELYLHLHASQMPDPDDPAPEVDGSAVVDPSAVLRGRVKIEAGARIGPRVVISGPAIVRRDACIDAGAIIGCEGLYAKTVRGERMHMPHFGGVEVGERAFIHAGAVIVRSAIRGEATRIGKDAHVGVMANVGHDAEVGEAATLSSHCVIAGRARIGAHAWVGASATISNAIRVGDHARVRIGAIVIRDVPERGDVSGNFAVEHARTLRSYLKGPDRET